MSEDAADGLVWDCNAFACRLFSELRAHSDAANLFMSPYSIASALSMALAGARGQTASELHRVLYPSLLPDEIDGAFSFVQQSLEHVSDVELAVAQRVWKIEAGDASDTFEAINQWVDEATRGRITKLVDRSGTSAGDALLVASAIYFHGLWEYPFRRRSTKLAWFHAENEKFRVPTMMKEFKSVAYAEVDGTQILELPYRGEDFGAMFVLPPPGSLAQVEAELDAAMLACWGDSLESWDVIVEIPRFQASSDLDLIGALRRLGIQTAFTPEADLSGFGGRPGVARINSIVHRALVEVDEYGTVAAAATAISLCLGKVTDRFIADRPFLFLIRDRRRELVLFLGRIGDPRA